MKAQFFALGLALSLFACTSEELPEDLNTVDHQGSSKAALDENLDRNISVFNPVNIPEGQLVEKQVLTGTVRDENGNTINTRNNATFTRGYLTVAVPNISFTATSYYLPLENGRFRFAGSNASSRIYQGFVENINRWHQINGAFYFLFAGFPNGTDTSWYRFKSANTNTGNLEVVRFQDDNVIPVADLNTLDANFARLVKQTIIVNSTDDRSNLGFFYVNFKAPTARSIPEGYESLYFNVEAIPLEGATIRSVDLFIQDRLINRERFFPYEWGAPDQRPEETLGLNNGSFFFDWPITVIATDSEGRTATVERTLLVGPSRGTILD